MRNRAIWLLLGLSMAVLACGAPSGAAKPSGAPAGAASAPSAVSTTSGAAQPAARPAPMPQRMVTGVVSLSSAPVAVARAKGFFAEDGVDLDWQLVQGGAAAVAALSGGDAQFAEGGASDIIGLNSRNLPVLGVISLANRIFFDTIVAKQYMAAKGVTPQSPLQQRVQALKGAKMGVSSVGGTPDRLGRWLMTQGGLQPDDVESIRVGNVSEIRTALRQGLIDGTLSAPPTGPQLEREEIGVVLIKHSEIPEFAAYPNNMFYVTKSYMDQNREAIERMGRATTRGAAFIHDNTAEAKQILQADFKDVDPEVLSLSVDLTKEAYPRDGKMTQAMWNNAMKVLTESGAIPRALDTAEGVLWTNQFLK